MTRQIDVKRKTENSFKMRRDNIVSLEAFSGIDVSVLRFTTDFIYKLMVINQWYTQHQCLRFLLLFVWIIVKLSLILCKWNFDNFKDDSLTNRQMPMGTGNFLFRTCDNIISIKIFCLIKNSDYGENFLHFIIQVIANLNIINHKVFNVFSLVSLWGKRKIFKVNFLSQFFRSIVLCFPQKKNPELS